MEFFIISLLNGVAYGLMLFMLTSGLTLIYSMMGILNFAHASFYMLGAYFAYQLSEWFGFGVALVLAPLLVGGIGSLVERFGLRKVSRFGHVPEILFTFGLFFLMEEIVHLIWGKSPVSYRVPEFLSGPLFTIFSTDFPIYKGFMMLVSLSMLLGMYLLLTHTRIGLIIRAAVHKPDMVEALGHNVPRIFMGVFGAGIGLAGLAGVIGGNAFVTEPGMAAAVGSIVFVVVVFGGLGSLAGAFIASLLLGIVQTFAVGLNLSLADLVATLAPGVTLSDDMARLTVSQTAPMLPYLLMVAMLIFRPRGLMGERDA